MAGARLRQTFKYPSDGEGSDVSHDEMDEEEQETLITKLQQTETTVNAYYVLFFTVLPLGITLSFVYFLLLSTSKSMTLACLLSITSLLSSSYIIYMIPTGTPLFTRPPATLPLGPRRGQRQQQWSLALSGLGSGGGNAIDSPLTLALPYFNVFISVLLVLLASRYRGRQDVPDGLWAFFLLPALVFVIILVVRGSINEIQSGLSDLRGMKYDYKGA